MRLATTRHRAGDLPEARRLYQQVLAEAPSDAAALFQLGLLELQAGNLEIALASVERAVASSPGEPRYQFGLGKVLAALNRWAQAAAACRLALAADPGSPEIHFDLGKAMQAQGDYRGAIVSYQFAVQYRSEFAEALNNLGNCHQCLGELPLAEAAYRRSLALSPSYAGAMSNLGTILLETSRVDEAAALFSAATKLEPDAPAHAVNLGAALHRQRNFAEAASTLRRVLDLDPNNADAAYNLGNVLAALGMPREAVEQYQHAAAIRPNHPEALINLGNMRKELGEFGLAAAAYEAALRAQPASLAALNNLSCLLRTLGRLEEAEAVLRRGIALCAGHPALYNNLGNVLKDSGALDEAIDCFRVALAMAPTDAAAHSNLCYSLSFQSLEGQPILEECLRFNASHAEPLQTEARGRHNDRLTGRPLRIGYVSPDFRDHCQSLFTIPLLSHHDHTRFKIFCYSSVERPDATTGRIAGYADVWREVRWMDDAALCDLIQSDQIDVLVDLSMHMADGRPLLFARKPAPVQVAWLAYPGTTGISAMDYRFTDPRLDPPGSESHYSERSIRLPDSFWCYDPLTDQPRVNDLPALANGYLTLGCLNNPCKLTDHTLALWAGVMRELPQARLLLMAPPGPRRQRVRDRLAALGVAPARVNFVPYRPRADYLHWYHEVDLGLDTFPYNGHTTSLDSLWMGVPVVTRVGRTCVGRGGQSQLFQLGLVELAAETDERFTQIAVALGQDLPRLGALRQQLRARLERSALMDADRFARHIEAAYMQMTVIQGTDVTGRSFQG